MLEITILLIESDDTLFRSIAEILESYGYAVIRSTGKDDTFLMLNNYNAGLIIIGKKVFDMKREELCVQIKQNDHFNEIPVMFITSIDNISERKQALEAGAIDYIPLPFDQQDIYSKVQIHIYLRNIEKRLGEQIKFTNILINHLPFGVMLIDDEGYITSLNDWLGTSLDYKTSANLNHLKQIMLENDYQMIKEIIHENKKKKTDLYKELEAKLIMANQNLMDVKLTLFSFNIEEKVYNIAVIEDLTFEKKKEQYHYFLIESLKTLQKKTTEYLELLKKEGKTKGVRSTVDTTDLSDIEKKIIRYIVEGNSNKEIALKVGYSEIYVRKKLSQLYKRFEVGSRFELSNLFSK